MNRFYLLLCVVALCRLDFTWAAPNIVVFLSDDHTWRDSSVYGSTDINTPHMQRVAAAGMTFDHAYVASPSCAPSRAALLTGLYPAKNGAEANHSRPEADIRKLPSYLQEFGYEVVSFGKVGHYAQTPEYGFDIARHYGYHEDIAIPKALEWLRARQSDKPLCLFVGSNWPHVPWPEELGDIDPAKLRIPPTHVTNPVTRAWRARYVAAIKKMDDELGQVFDLAREKLGEDTLFMHTSDHGAQWPFAKWNLYDSGTRTPLIVSWPGKIEPGSRSQAMVSWIDILPTLLAVAGGKAEGLDGRSFLPVLLGEKAKHRDVIFTTHSGDGNHNVYPSRAVRTPGGWKYIRNLHPEFRYKSHATEKNAHEGYWPSWVQKAVKNPDARRKVQRYQQRPGEELYNVNQDPYEQTNLADDPAHTQRLAGLRKALDGWMDHTADPQSVFGRPQQRVPKTKPNIITVFIDDMGWSDLSCFGGKAVQTEHIDRLAAEGIKFTQFYVNSPICSPSRVALSTGQYPQRWRISSYLANRENNRKRGMAQWLDPAAPMLARELHHGGYATGHFGKWHMGGQRDVGDAPLITAYGFARSLTNFEGLGPRVLPLKDAYDGKPPKKHDLGSGKLGKGPIFWEDRSMVTAAFVKEALTFIDHAQALDQPFYINLWPDDVHSPFFPPKVLRDQTDGSKRALYYAVLDAMDQQLGVLFDRVRSDEALNRNTLILVCSDNGHEDGAGRSDPLRGAKTWLYEGGVRSPLIAWGPGVVAEQAAGTVNEQSVFSAIDVNRSLYTLAGIPLPDGVQLDGEDLADTLLGRNQASRTAPIFWRRPPDRGGYDGKDNPDLAVRSGEWKYCVNYDGSNPQLYNLKDDIGETRNLAAQHPELVRRLQVAIDQWNAGMPQDAANAPKPEPAAALPADQFVNPIGEGADPWVVRDEKNDRYLWCFSDGNRGIAVHASKRLTSLGKKYVVWRAPSRGPVSRQVWAPELHLLDGRWHIYFAASDGKNENHLTYVLRAKTDDPLGAYELHGPVDTGGVWAIDMTPFEHGGKRYALWSGWDAPGTDRQYLYIAPMKSPMEIGGPRVRICGNDDYPWEITEPGEGGRGLNEAPQVIKTGRRTFVTYSCAASWLPSYKLGLLELTGRNPLDPSAWVKHKRPVFSSTPQTFGVGHSCFVPSPDGSELWHVFHAKRDRKPGWRRAVFVQPMRIGPQGFPLFGRPVAPGFALNRPAGETPGQAKHSHPSDLTDLSDHWSYFGHHQYAGLGPGGLHLGRVPEHPINEYRSGEKVVLNAPAPESFVAGVTIDFLGNAQARDAGLLLRTTAPSVGFDAQRGYFAGLIPKTQLVIFGKTDGRHWTELKRAKVRIDPSQLQRLQIVVRGDSYGVRVNGKNVLAVQDDTYARGTVGLRVVDTHAVFSKFSLNVTRSSTP